MKKALLAAVLGATVAGGAAFLVVRLTAAPTDEAIAFVPSNAIVYASVFLDPGTDQKRALEDILSHFPPTDTSQEVTTLIERLLNEPFDALGIDMTYRDDVEPWLGDQIAFYARVPQLLAGETSPDVAAFIGTKDIDAAMDAVELFLEEQDIPTSDADFEAGDETFEFQRIEGGAAVGALDDFIVIGTESGFRAAATAGSGESLKTSENYLETLDIAQEERLAHMYLNVGPLLRLLPGASLAGSPLGGLSSPTSISLYLKSDAVVVETSRAVSDGASDGARPLEIVPSGAWAAFGISGAGEQATSLLGSLTSNPITAVDVRSALEKAREDFGVDVEAAIAAIDDLAFYSRGQEPDIEAGAVATTTDVGTTTGLIDNLGSALVRRGIDARPAEGGFVVEGIPNVYLVAQQRLHLVATEGDLPDDLEGGSLEDDPGYIAAARRLGESFEPSGFVDLDQILELILAENSDEAFDKEVRPYLGPLGFVIFGSSTEGERSVGRFMVGLDG